MLTTSKLLQEFNKGITLNLGDKTKASESDINLIIQEATKISALFKLPQVVHTLIITGDRHKKLWQMIKVVAKTNLSATEYQKLEDDFNAFIKARGSIFFFSNLTEIKDFSEQNRSHEYEAYNWSEEAQGLIQVLIGEKLMQQGLGFNLQHFNPLINAPVKAEFDIPEKWQLRAQMNFGSI